MNEVASNIILSENAKKYGVPMYWNSNRERFYFAKSWSRYLKIKDEWGTVQYLAGSWTDSCTIGSLRKIIKPDVYKRTAGCLVHDWMLEHGFTSKVSRNTMRKVHKLDRVNFFLRNAIYYAVAAYDVYAEARGYRKHNTRTKWQWLKAQ